MSTSKITKNLLEAVNSILTGQKLQEASYIDKKNHKASNINQLEDLLAAELDLGGVDDEDLKNLLTHFKKGYSIAVAVGAADKRELKKDGYVPGPFAIYKDMDERNQEIYIKAPAGMKESTEGLEEASGFAYDIQRGTSPHEFIADFDEIEGTHVGDWMRSIEAMQRLMKAANTNSYEFKEVVLPKAKADTKDEVEKQWKTKGYKLFDYAITKKGETFLLFYKKA